MSDAPVPAHTGLLPNSTALAEASPESLTELFSRDPEGYQRQDRDRIVEVLRAQRAKFEKAEAEGKRAPRQPKLPAAPKTLETSAKIEDLGL